MEEQKEQTPQEQHIGQDPQATTIPFDSQRKIRELWAGYPVFTAIPTHVGFENERVFVDDGTSYKLYVYRNAAWRKVGDSDFIRTADLTKILTSIPRIHGVQTNAVTYQGAAINSTSTGYGGLYQINGAMNIASVSAFVSVVTTSGQIRVGIYSGSSFVASFAPNDVSLESGVNTDKGVVIRLDD